MKMRALKEKYILKKSMQNLLPAYIVRLTKQPYMAPDAKSFFGGSTVTLYRELLSEENVAQSGYFNPRMVSSLVKKCSSNQLLGFKDNMALVGIVSTLLLHEKYIERFHEHASLKQTDQSADRSRSVRKPEIDVNNELSPI